MKPARGERGCRRNREAVNSACLSFRPTSCGHVRWRKEALVFLGHSMETFRRRHCYALVVRPFYAVPDISLTRSGTHEAAKYSHCCLWKWPHQKTNRFVRRCHPYASLPQTRFLVGCSSPFMRLAPTPHGASCLVQAMSAWSVKPRSAPSWHCSDATAYGLTNTAEHDMSTSSPSSLPTSET